MLYLRVNKENGSDVIDLPELVSMRLGWNALTFNEESDDSVLVMKSEGHRMESWTRFDEAHSPNCRGWE